MEGDHSASSFTSAVSLDKLGVSSIPQRYVLPPSQRPSPHVPMISTTLPIIDLSTLWDQSVISRTIDEIGIACKEIGCFQVINHEIDQSVMDEALEVATEFFNLPNDEKMRLFSQDVHKPVRYGTSLNQARDEVYCWRDFIKHYSYPISDWIHMWPSNPSNYRYRALVVQLGDQMEVMSNGQYKSVIHRATVNGDDKRFSIVSLHSFAMDRKMGPALELVNDQHPKSYKEFCFREFLDFISGNDITKGRFLDTLKMKKL
ncbi:hypothetical protein JHK82_026068 [Glycine max]|nr:hypothetical protein JHK85_026677 [Glycine max]KAG5013932.1 hypothetical protein JHK86_026193 [Glycine max]KAG5134880.1 hypothetical protein JHK82_026068 [Glycine max]